jgi:hypothetical protein
MNYYEIRQTKITRGYNLKAKYVINTAGPVYSKNKECKILLKSCYNNSISFAKANNCKSIDFHSSELESMFTQNTKP